MKRFFEKYGDFDEDDALRYIKRHLDGYARGGSGGSSSSSYHTSGESILQELGMLIEMIEDFFAEKGLDPRSYMESHRRGGGRGR